MLAASVTRPSTLYMQWNRRRNDDTHHSGDITSFFDMARNTGLFEVRSCKEHVYNFQLVPTAATATVPSIAATPPISASTMPAPASASDQKADDNETVDLPFGDIHYVPYGQSGKTAPFVESPISIMRCAIQVGSMSGSDVICDLGCGQGGFLNGVLQTVPGARGVGVDIDPKLIATAKEEAKANGLSDRVRYEVMDFFSGDDSWFAKQGITKVPSPALRFMVSWQTAIAD